ncbi:MAG: response regulator [Bacteroidetes bacterium]|nr:MAG: response regulator [Bacteroidota bacterium]
MAGPPADVLQMIAHTIFHPGFYVFARLPRQRWAVRAAFLIWLGGGLVSLSSLQAQEPAANDSLLRQEALWADSLEHYLRAIQDYNERGQLDSAWWAGERGVFLGLALQDSAQLPTLYFHLQRTATLAGDTLTADSLYRIYRRYQAYWGYSIEDDYQSFNNAYRYTRVLFSLLVLPDSGRNIAFDSLHTPAVQARFVPNQTLEGQLDPETDYWIRLRLHGRPDTSLLDLFMVGVDEASWDTVDIYFPKPDGEWRRQRTGRRLLPEQKTALKDWRNLFQVQVPAGESMTLYLHLRGYSAPRGIGGIFLYHLPPDYLTETEARAQHYKGIFLGILLAQGLYFLLLFLATREKSYLPYLLYLFGVTTFAATTYGFSRWFPLQMEYVWFIYFGSAGLAGVGLLTFASSYLNIKRLFPSWHRITQIFTLIFVLPPSFFIAILVGASISREEVSRIRLIDTIANVSVATFFLLISLGLILIVTLGILAWRKGYRPAAPFLVGIFFLITLVGVTPVLVVLQPIVLVEHLSFAGAVTAAQLGIVLQLIFFALGVGQKIKLLQAESAAALEAQLQSEQEANEKLRQADRLKDEFLANTSHELRTPLNGIIGISEAVRDGVAGPTTPEMRDNLGMVIHSARRLSGLVNDILDFAKLKNAELTLQARPLDLAPLVRLVLKVNDSALEGRNLRLKVAIPDDLPPVLADENRLQQILYNLIGNAIKFTGEGEVEVSAEAKGDMVAIRVRDTGIGISPEQQERIFQAFEQGDGSVSRRYGGTGLGLSITRQLVELHGGRIWVESAPGQGAVFSFTLPTSQEAAGTVSGADTEAHYTSLNPVVDLARETAHAAGDQLVSRSGPEISRNGIYHILVVDDEPVNRQVLKNHLSAEDYCVTSVMNGEQALAAVYSDQHFDLVLLDVMMPRMSGFEVCQKIREKYLPSELPVIMITAKNQVSDLVTGLSFGANDYIVKPFSKPELLARIKTHLNLLNISTATSRFVPHEFLASLGRETITEVRLGDQVARDGTVLFSDIRGYTSMAESMTPEETFAFLNAYLGRMGPVIQTHGGFVNQFFGDGIMSLFLTSPDDALLAANEMLEVLRLYNLERDDKGREPLQIGIGLHYGSLMMGMIGDEQRLDTGLVSDTVNTTSRLEGLTKILGVQVLVSAALVEGLAQPERFRLRYLGKVRIRGRQGAMGLYEALDGLLPVVQDRRRATQALFEEALAHYQAADFAAAGAAFAAVLQQDPADGPARYYQQRCEAWEAAGRPQGWEQLDVVNGG